jgi:hypothetical protein
VSDEKYEYPTEEMRAAFMVISNLGAMALGQGDDEFHKGILQFGKILVKRMNEPVEDFTQKFVPRLLKHVKNVQRKRRNN